MAPDVCPITVDLGGRPARPPDHAAENRALVALAAGMAASPTTILQKLADTALELCRADSAGVSVLEVESGGQVFRWRAASGAFAAHLGGVMPRDASPCGVVLDRDEFLVFAYPQRHFAYPVVADPPPVEALLVPFRVGGTPVGVVWAVAHSPSRQFDAEDARLLTSLSEFAAAAVRVAGGLAEAAATRTRLEEAEGRLKLLIESATDHAIYSLGVDGRVATWNAGAERIFGWPEAEILGKDGALLFTPEDRAAGAPEEEMRTARERGRAEDKRWHIRRDGTRFFASGVLTPIRDGELRGYAKVCRDVTERRMANQSVRESEERLRVALDAGRSGVWEWDIVAGRITWCDRVAEFYGMRPGEFDGTFETFARHIHPDDAERARAAVRAAVEEDAPYLIEYRIVRADGEVRWIYTAGKVVRAPDGTPLRMVGATTDVTERKRAEETLARNARILANVRDSVIVTDLAGVVTYWNRGATRLFGWTAEEMLGRPVAERVPPEARGDVAAMLGEIASGTDFAGEWQDYRKDGARVWIDARVSRIKDEDGRPAGILGISHEITDRKGAEEALRHREEQLRHQEAELRLVTDSAPVYLAHCDADARFLFVNRPYAARFGLTPEEVVGRRIPDIVGEGAYRRLARYVDEATAGRAVEFEVSLPYRSSTRVVHAAYVPEPGPAGARVGFVAVIQDVTDQRAAEAAARGADARALAILESITEGFLVLDAEWNFAYMNAAFERMNGVRREDVLGRNHWEVYPATVGTRLEAEYRRVLATGETAEFEYYYEPCDRWFAVKAYPAQGGGLSIQVREITAAKWAGEALRESEERYRSLFNSIDEGFCVIEVLFDAADRPRDYRFLETNPAFEKQTGLRGAAGRTMRELAPQHEGHWFETYGRVARTGESVRFVNEARALGGRWFDVYAFRLGGPDSPRVAVLFSDITDRRRNEQERERLVAQLREADRRKDEFLATLAHELRNPLVPIRNGLELIRLSEDRAVRERSQAMMDRQLAHMVRLIDDLLDVSRITRGKMELRRSRIRLADAVASAVETARSAVESAEQELAVSLPAEPVYLDADLTRLAQIFGNLLVNSTKYTGRGGHIRLAAERRGDEVVVSVRDTGIGIPAKYLSTVFDMFSQVDRSVERNTGGLGIGLALVKGLVEMHGGTVTAESEGPGRGSTFTVRLPVATDPESLPATPAVVVENLLHPRRVLVVDDNRDGAGSMADMLTLLGHEVHLAHDGVEAVEAAERVRPDVILMDVGMPRLNGLDATRQIRERSWGKAVTIVALTGWGQEADRERSRAAGCDGHLVKPVAPADLRAVLTRAETTGDGS